MADDVTLLPCPFCGAPAEVYAPYKIIRCSNPDCLMEVRTMVNLREERRAEVWNTRVSDPRIAALEAELADARDCIDLFNRMIVRAECAWKEQHPDSEFYPDVPDLIVWLKEQVDALKERRCETCEWWQSRQADWGYCYHDERGQKWLGNDSCPLWEAKGTRGGQ